MTTSVAVFDAAIRIKLINMKSWLKTRKIKNMEIKQRNCYINLHLQWFMDRIHSLLKRADARRNADIVYRMCAYSYFVGQA